MMDFLDEITYNDIDDWLASKPKEFRDEHGNDASACWIAALYIADYFKTSEEIEIEITNPSDIPDGLYSCRMENKHEFHEFLLYCNAERITIYGTYGGIPAFVHYSMSKDKFNGLMNIIFKYGDDRNGDAWRKLFSIPKEVKIPKILGTSTLTLQKLVIS